MLTVFYSLLARFFNVHSRAGEPEPAGAGRSRSEPVGAGRSRVFLAPWSRSRLKKNGAAWKKKSGAGAGKN